MRGQTDKDIIMHVSVVSIIWNVVLTFFKLAVGLTSASAAMIADSIHSASDVLSTFLVIAGAHMASKAPDKEHPYGHERMECAVSLILAFMLLGTGLMIGAAGLTPIFSGEYKNIGVPGKSALAAAVISVIVKELMYRYTIRAARKTGSVSLKADAWHHRSDAVSSVGSFAGILGALLGFPAADLIASAVISLMIIKAAADILRETLYKLVDHSCDAQTIKKIKQIAEGTEGVVRVDLIKTRLFGSKIYVDIEIAEDGAKTLFQTHKTAQLVHDAVESQLPEVKHCMVHVNPII